jgi:hypothetical protein
VLRKAYFYRCACFANVTSATITRDILYTLLHLAGNSNRSGVHQRPMECSYENGPDIETVSNASEFLGDTLNVWDDSSLVYCI